MDIHYFALSRIDFISKFYQTASFPFVETKSLIEGELPPYELVYSEATESDEPQFLQEWLDADQSIDILGIQCASLLCSTLKLFLEESVKNVFRRNSGRVTKSIKTEVAYKSDFKKGWLNGYRELFEKEFSINWLNSGVNLTLIEELILVRNRGQHPEEITTMGSFFSKSDLEKVPSPFFTSDKNRSEFIRPILQLPPGKIQMAIEESIKLVNWLEFELIQWGKDQIA